MGLGQTQWSLSGDDARETDLDMATTTTSSSMFLVLSIISTPCLLEEESPVRTSPFPVRGHLVKVV